MPRRSATLWIIRDSWSSICPSASAIWTIHASRPCAEGAAAVGDDASVALAPLVALASICRASAGERTAVRTHPRLPSFRAVPHDSHTPLVPPVSGAPQLGQWAEEMTLPGSVFT